jgi:hypothetical protein
MSSRDYRIGETVLMDYNGWLKAFRVVGIERDGPYITYTMSMLELEGGPRWVKPGV